MSERVEWIRDGKALAARLARIGRGPVGLDTEADSMHHYPEKVCLVQLSFGGVDLLVDPLAGVDLSLLGPWLADETVPKILHGADYDLRVLHRDFGLTVAGLFDTMVAARLTGETAFGLADLLSKHLGVQLDKRFQRADWSQRPLPEAMERYAVLDTRHLQPLSETLAERLRELGRTDWAAEEFRQLERVRWSGNQEKEGFQRVKGSSSLDRRRLAVLRELHAMRERQARERDRPPFKILRDDALLVVARAAPSDASAFAGLRVLPAAWRSGGRARMLLDAVRRGLATPESELPEPRSRRPRPTRMNSAQQARLRELRRFRDRLAADLGLDPAVIAPRAMLEGLAQRLDRGEDPGRLPDIRRWQIELLRPAL